MVLNTALGVVILSGAALLTPSSAAPANIGSLADATKTIQNDPKATLSRWTAYYKAPCAPCLKSTECTTKKCLNGKCVFNRQHFQFCNRRRRPGFGRRARRRPGLRVRPPTGSDSDSSLGRFGSSSDSSSDSDSGSSSDSSRGSRSSRSSRGSRSSRSSRGSRSSGSSHSSRSSRSSRGKHH